MSLPVVDAVARQFRFETETRAVSAACAAVAAAKHSSVASIILRIGTPRLFRSLGGSLQLEKPFRGISDVSGISNRAQTAVDRTSVAVGISHYGQVEPRVMVAFKSGALL